MALSEFYSQWSQQEAERQATYTREWHRRHILIIKLTIHHQIQLWKEIITRALIGRPS